MHSYLMRAHLQHVSRFLGMEPVRGYRSQHIRRFWGRGAHLRCAARTGCGAVALALGLLEPRIAHIYAVDSSAEALTVARANGDRYLLTLLISWLHGDALEPIPEPVDLIIASRTGRDSSLEQVGSHMLPTEPSSEG